jgi:hypothetical protein
MLVCCASGCNRAAVRIPGASLSFPETPTRYTAKISFPYTVAVPIPADQRAQHYGERVAGTRWTGCSTDAFWSTDAAQLIQQRLVTELQSSGLFSKVSSAPASPDDVVLRSEIHAFCSQAVGFLFIRVAGISALRVSLERNGKILFDYKFERVVTDADKEYSGSQVTFIEQAMSVTMADSLRELIKDMLKRFEAEATTWKQGAANKSFHRIANKSGSR